MSKEKTPGKTSPKTKSRRHGYRGYGSPLRKDQGGAVHIGRGFSGVEFPGGGPILPPAPEVPARQPREKESREDSSKKK